MACSTNSPKHNFLPKINEVLGTMRPHLSKIERNDPIEWMNESRGNVFLPPPPQNHRQKYTSGIGRPCLLVSHYKGTKCRLSEVDVIIRHPAPPPPQSRSTWMEINTVDIVMDVRYLQTMTSRVPVMKRD